MIEDAKRVSLVIVDDEIEIGEFIAETGRKVGWNCTVLTDAAHVWPELDRQPELIMLDLMMPGVDGVELLRLLAQRGCTAAIVLMSGFDRRVLATAEQLAKTLGLRVAGQFTKPIRLPELEAFLARVHLGPQVTLRPGSGGVEITASELAQALRADDFELHYQPQVEFASGTVVGVEALVRWRHPDKGLLYPDTFIGVAESHGLIDDLGWMVICRAVRDAKALEALGKNIRISINVSAHSLNDLSMPDRIVACASAAGVPATRLMLEITESGLARELAKALDILTRLRLKNLQLSIDDFGTGYSMMDQLRRVPATELKIDKGFVQTMLVDEAARIVAEKTIEMGHSLQMHVVAEGVETREQELLLARLGCDIGQGYFYSKPLPLSAIVDWHSVFTSRSVSAT